MLLLQICRSMTGSSDILLHLFLMINGQASFHTILHPGLGRWGRREGCSAVSRLRFSFLIRRSRGEDCALICKEKPDLVAFGACKCGRWSDAVVNVAITVLRRRADKSEEVQVRK